MYYFYNNDNLELIGDGPVQYNFYKLNLLYELSKTYDEILYLDFDVVCLTKDNFFDNWNLDKGIAVFDNTYKVNTIETITKQTQTIRSPTAKYYNTQAMLIDKGLDPNNAESYEIYNQNDYGPTLMHNEALSFLDRNRDNNFLRDCINILNNFNRF